MHDFGLSSLNINKKKWLSLFYHLIKTRHYALFSFGVDCDCLLSGGLIEC